MKIELNLKATTDGIVKVHPRSGTRYVTVYLNDVREGGGMLWTDVIGGEDDKSLSTAAVEVARLINVGRGPR